MIPSTLRAFALAPVTYVPRRGRSARTAYLPVDAFVRPVPLDAGEAPVLLVHAGQGRSHARPIHAVGGRLFTPVMAMVPGDGERPVGVVPREAGSVLDAIGTREGLARLAMDGTAQAALQGTPLMARATTSDSKVRIETLDELRGATVLRDGRDLARSALESYFEEDVRICDGRFLVAMQGPLVHLNQDRWTMTASLNPALVDLRGATIPVFHPLFQALDRVCELMRAGVAKGPIYPIAPQLDHLDPNPALPPNDLVSIPRDWEAGTYRAARATALLAPLFALLATRHALSRLPEDRAGGLRGLAAEVAESNAWGRLGLTGPVTLAESLGDCLRLVEGAIDIDASLVRWQAKAFAEQARKHAMPCLSPETPGADRDALSALAP